MFQPQNFFTLSREHRLLRASPSTPNDDPDPLDVSGDPGVRSPTTPPPDAPDVDPESDADFALEGFVKKTTLTGSERARQAVVAKLTETKDKSLQALKANIAKRRGKDPSIKVSAAFDDVTKKFMKARVKELEDSGDGALKKLGEASTRSDSGFLFLDFKYKQLQAYKKLLQEERGVYEAERDRYAVAFGDMENTPNNVCAAEIAENKLLEERIDALIKKVQADAAKMDDSKAVDAVRKGDANLRGRLMEEAPEYFSKADLNDLIFKAVSGNPEELVKAINAAIKDPNKREALKLMVNRLNYDSTIGVKATFRDNAVAFGRAFATFGFFGGENYLRGKYGKEYAKNDQRRRAIAQYYTEQILESKKDMNDPDIGKRMGVLGSLPVGTGVHVQEGGTKFEFSIAGLDKKDGSSTEFVILRDREGRYAAIDRDKKEITFRTGKKEKNRVATLTIGDIPPKDPRVMSLKATPKP